MRGDVIVYHVVWTKVKNLEGETPEDLIKQAVDVSSPRIAAICSSTEGIEDAESIGSYLVDVLDEEGDIDESLGFTDSCQPAVCVLRELRDKIDEALEEVVDLDE